MGKESLIGFFIMLIGILLMFYGISFYKTGINIFSPNLVSGQKGIFFLITGFVVVIFGLFILKVIFNRKLY